MGADHAQSLVFAVLSTALIKKKFFGRLLKKTNLKNH